MTKDKELIVRWRSRVGKIAVRALADGLRAGESQRQLHHYVSDLERVDEVAPALDLRGIVIPDLIGIATRDLSGTRFDGATLQWNFSGCSLRAAVFDQAKGRNVDFGGCDLTGSSFVHADLPGAIFFQSKLREANLTRASLHDGQLKGADCRDAKFIHADLRRVWAAEADLRGADFSEANLIGASLGRAQWDDATNFHGAKLTHEGTPAEIRAKAIVEGASIGSEKADWQLALLDATRAALKMDKSSGRAEAIVQRLAELRPQLKKDPQLLWTNVLKKELDEEQWRELQSAVRKAASNMGALG